MGTPYCCIIVDFNTLEGNMVTMEQFRVDIKKVCETLDSVKKKC